MNRHTSDRCTTDQQRPVPAEVSRPLMPSGVEETHEFCPGRDMVNTRQIWSFMTIAMQAGAGQVRQYGSAAVLLGNDVFDFVGAGVERLGQ